MEFDYGDYDGLSYSQFKEDDPVIAQWKHNPGTLCFPMVGVFLTMQIKPLRDLRNW